MTQPDFLAKPAYLLAELQRDAHALPVRLRVLNMLTYALDMVYIHNLPGIIEEARYDNAAATRVRSITAMTMQMLNDAADTLRNDILPVLDARGLFLRSVEECAPAQRAWLRNTFVQRVRPLLTPLAVDAGRPFPQISAHSLNLLAVVQQPNSFDVDMPSFARLKVPRKVPRLIELGADGPTNGALPTARTFVLSEDMVRAHVQDLFPGVQVEGVYQFRILRGSLPNGTDVVGRHAALARQKAWPVVRLDVEPDMPAYVLRWLLENMGANEAVVLRRVSPLGIGSLAAEWADRAEPG
jgi:polyphosphate kinase